MAVGIGNTTIKLGEVAGLTADGWPMWKRRDEIATAELTDDSLAKLQLSAEPRNWCVASVHRAGEARLQQWVRRAREQDTYRRLTHRDLPIEIRVDAPDKVGLDRLAAAVAANRLRKTRPAVVVDAGTAITVNLVSRDGAFEGGVILPGFALTATALAGGTDALPLIRPDFRAEPPGVVGKSTEAAIRSGLFWGNVGAVREIVHRVASELDQPPQVFVTGGDAQRLAGFMAPDAQFVPDLVLAGIYFSVLESPVP